MALIKNFKNLCLSFVCSARTRFHRPTDSGIVDDTQELLLLSPNLWLPKFRTSHPPISEEVERFALPKHKDTKNSDDDTPMMVFRKQHENLRKEGEEWMKKTADSYTITAALIITIVFAAAITVPGGNDGDTGDANFLKKKSVAFIIFAVSDAISLFTSPTSLLLFLSILTARYAEQDFLYSLPKRLVIGLATLFMSMTSMMIAFSATLFLMFGQGRGWILIPIATLTCLPIASFVTLQFPLLVELISSTYGRGIFGKQSDRRLY